MRSAEGRLETCGRMFEPRILNILKMFSQSLIDSMVTFYIQKGGNPGLVVMGGDLCFEGRGFESRRHMVIISHEFVVRIVMIV